MKQGFLFLDGRLMRATKAILHDLSPGILRGQGVFETMRAENGKILFIDDHLSRLFSGLRKLRIKFSFSSKQLKLLIQQTLEENYFPQSRIRVTIWQERKKVRLCIVILELKREIKSSLTVTVARTKINRSASLVNVKSIQYADYLNAYQRASQKGYNEAIILNKSGFLVEGSRTNIFFVKDGKLFTPSLACGCLNGITRRVIIQLAKRIKLPIYEGKYKPKELFSSDEVFLTNSIIKIKPVRFINDQAFTAPGPTTQLLLKKYLELV